MHFFFLQQRQILTPANNLLPLTSTVIMLLLNCVYLRYIDINKFFWGKKAILLTVYICSWL